MARRAISKSSPRERALRVLMECADGTSFGRQTLESLQSDEPLASADAGLAAELVAGVLRHRITAEHIAARFHHGRWVGLRESLRLILALGVYQLCWLDRIPDHAAIDEAVRQAKRRGRHAGGLVNAVLRAVARSRGEVVERPEAPDPKRYLPVDKKRGRLFTDDVFPDPARHPLEHIIAVTGHPPWLVERWHRRFKPARCREICDAGARRPRRVVRTNRTRITRDELIARFDAAGHGPRPVGDGDAIMLGSDARLDALPEFTEGLCQPQDGTAQIALTLAPPAPGQLVLDYCAGVGTKSTQAAEQMDNRGTVIAYDTNTAQLDRLVDNARRLGLDIIAPTPKKRLAEALAACDCPPDLIIADAPCTNTGVLSRRPEARYRASRKGLDELVEIQRGILREIAPLAGPTTRILYSTCSLEAEENEQQVAWFCEMFADWRMETDVFTTPNDERDGGYAAVLVQAST